MAKPDGPLVLKWRELAEEGYLYAEISRMHPPFSVDQVRHYCLGHTGRKVGGPIQKVEVADSMLAAMVKAGYPDSRLIID